MSEFWYSLTLFQQILLCIAVPVTLILIVQFVLLLFGIGGDSTAEATVDLDGDGIPDDVSNTDQGMAFTEIGGLRLFTLRGILAFLSIGGWTALVVSIEYSVLLATVIGLLAGATADILYAMVMRAVLRLQENGAIRMKNAVGLTGEVYIPIPPQQTANGKINLILQGKLCEEEAVWNGNDFLPTGTKVTVTGILGDTLIVAPLPVEQAEPRADDRTGE